VSWLMIEPGWKVVAAGGEEVGSVEEVAGDSTIDIFDGLAIATSALGKPRYVPAEQVAEITEGTVRLSLTAEQAAQLGEYREPATGAETGSEGMSQVVEKLVRLKPWKLMLVVLGIGLGTGVALWLLVWLLWMIRPLLAMAGALGVLVWLLHEIRERRHREEWQ